MEDFFIFLLIVFLVAWCLVLPILAIIFITKYRGINKRLNYSNQNKHLSNNEYSYLLGKTPFIETLPLDKPASEKISPDACKIASNDPTPTDTHPVSSPDISVSTNEPETTKKAPQTDTKRSTTGLTSFVLPPKEIIPNDAFQFITITLPTTNNQTDNCLQRIALAKTSQSEFAIIETNSISEPAPNATSDEIENSTQSHATHEDSVNSVPKTTHLVCKTANFTELSKQTEKPHQADASVTTALEIKQDNDEAIITENKTQTTLIESENDSKLDKLSREQSLSETSAAKSENTYHLPIILAIGVVLLCTAGAAWIASIWGSASNFVKIISMASFSVIFFGAFALAHRVLQIPNSARAFYILGVSGLGTAAIGAEILGIVFTDCALVTQFLLPTAIMTFGMGIGYKIFRSPLFIALSIILAYTFLTSLSASIFSSGWMFSFIPACIVLIAFIWYRRSKPEIQTKSRVYIQDSLIVSIVLAAISGIAVDSAFESHLPVNPQYYSIYSYF